MDEGDLRDLLAAVRELLRPHLARSEPLRRIVAHVGALLVDEARRARDGGEALEAAAEPPGAAKSPPAEPLEAPAPGGIEDHVAAEVALKVGDSSVQVPVLGTSEEIARAEAAFEPKPPAPPAGAPREATTDEYRIDLQLIESRCHLKAESCRLFIERRAAAGDEIRERPVLDRMNDMIAVAKSRPNCFLWVFWRDAEQPDDASLRTIGACYEAMGRAAGLLRQVGEIPDARDAHVEQALDLAAEANSGLRVALEGTWLSSPDVDQDELHQWLRRETGARSYFIKRFMTLDDPADPRNVADLAPRLDALAGQVEDHADRLKQITEGFKKLQYHADQLDPVDGTFDDYHYSRIADAIDTLDRLGVPGSNVDFRELIDENLAASFPPDHASSAAVQRVLSCVREYHESRAEADGNGEDPAAERWSERVHEVRDLLAGSVVVMLGGERRPEAIRRIKGAFRLADLRWVPLSEHGRGQPMLAPIQHPDTRLVLVLVKLIGHHQADMALAAARSYDKPLVMLPAGYNPEQIAEAVLQQVSDRLAADVLPPDA